MEARYCLDTNVFITAWNILYPPEVFPSLWEQLAEHAEQLVVIKPVYHELKGKMEDDEVFVWVRSQSFVIEKLTSEMDQTALEMEKEYEIRQGSKGVNSVDIRLISYARHSRKTVVTLEAQQPQLPEKNSIIRFQLSAG